MIGELVISFRVSYATIATPTKRIRVSGVYIYIYIYVYAASLIYRNYERVISICTDFKLIIA